MSTGAVITAVIILSILGAIVLGRKNRRRHAMGMDAVNNSNFLNEINRK